jgi:hypothetical protein
MKHPGGRPSDYNPEILKKAEKYLNGGWKKEGDAVPIVEGLALSIGVARDTVYQWAKDPAKPEFSDIFRQVLATQARLLASNGLNGTFQPTITKLFLSKHGYVEKTETDHTSGGEKITGINYIVPNGTQSQTDTQAAPGVSVPPGQ